MYEPQKDDLAGFAARDGTGQCEGAREHDVRAAGQRRAKGDKARVTVLMDGNMRD